MYKISISLIVDSLNEFKKFYQRITDYTDDNSFYELILLDKTLDKEFYKYYLKELESFSNIKYIDGMDFSISELYNKALDISTGEYLNFTSTSTLFSKDYIYKIGYYVMDYNIEILSLRKDKDKVFKTGFVDLLKDNFFYDCLDGYFFNREIISLTRFSLDIDYSFSKIKFIFDVMMKTNKYFFIKEIYYKNDFNCLLEKKFYNDFFKEFLLSYIKKVNDDLGYVPIYVQKYILGVIVDRFKFNLNKDNYFLDKREEKSFYLLIGRFLFYILDEVIIEYVQEKDLLIYLLKLKNKDFKFEIIDQYIYLNNIKTNLVNDELFTINKIDVLEEDILIEGYFSINLELDIRMDFNGEKIKAEKNVFSDEKIFNTEINNYLYIYKIKLNDVDGEIKFQLENNYLRIDFDSIFSKINKSIFSNYRFDKKILYSKNNSIFVKKNFWRRVFFYFNFNNLFYIFLSFFFKKNLVVLFEPFKYDYMLDNSLYNVYYIDNGNFNYKDVSFKRINSKSIFLKLYLYYSDLIVSNDIERVKKLLVSRNSYIKSRFKNNIIIMPSIKDDINNKKGKDYYNNFIEYIDKLK